MSYGPFQEYMNSPKEKCIWMTSAIVKWWNDIFEDTPVGGGFAVGIQKLYNGIYGNDKNFKEIYDHYKSCEKCQKDPRLKW